MASGWPAVRAAGRVPGVLLLAALLISSCNSSNPVAPGPGDPRTPGTGFTLTLTVDPSQLVAGSGIAATVTVTVRDASGTPPGDGSLVRVNTDLGNFGSDASGPITLVTLALVGGRAITSLFPADEPGEATVLAQFGENLVQQLKVRFVEETPRPFFLSFVEPSTGAPGGGEEVEIRGGGFETPLRVSFGAAVAKVLSSSASQIRVETPAVPGGVASGSTLPVDVVVTIRLNQQDQAIDTLASGFTYVPGGGNPAQPRVFSVSPPSGSNDGGTRVTVLGEGFEPPVQVFFGLGATAEQFEGLEATVEAATANQITVLTPPAAGIGVDLRNQVVSILVKNVASGFSTVAQSAFRYLSQTPLFSIDGFSPLEGPASGGTSITLRGSGFEEPVQVTLGVPGGTEIEQPGVTSVGSTQIVFETTAVAVTTCPADGVAFQGPVNVRILDALATSAQIFRYLVPIPKILSLSTSTGSQAGSTSVIVTGQDFEAPVRVRLSANSQTFTATVTSVTSSTVELKTPAVTEAAFDQTACDDNGDGQAGTRLLATGFDVVVENVATGCTSDVLPNGFTYQPADVSCRNDVAPVPPIANFNATGNGLTVSFTDASTGNPSTFSWDFGDGASSTQKNTLHTYSAAGDYAVTLTVGNVAGTDSVTKTVTVTAP